MRVFKYELDPHNPLIPMPEGAKVLSAGEQNGSVYIWAIVDNAFDQYVKAGFSEDQALRLCSSSMLGV